MAEMKIKGFVTLLEKGNPIQVAKEIGNALVKSDPNNYQWPKGKSSGKTEEKTKKSDLKIVSDPVETEKEADHKSDAKFTVEDIMALKYEEVQALAKKMEVPTRGKKKIIAQRIYDKSQAKN